MPFYEDLGAGRFRATTETTGPWDARHQHGGPPAALLGRAVERAGVLAPAEVTRMSFDLLGPVPVGELDVTATVVRPGRRVELVEAALSADGRACMVARAWRMLATDTRAVATEPQLPPEPVSAGQAALPPEGWVEGYVNAVEWRPVRGGFGALGPATVWCRQRLPLIEGEESTPLQRLLTVVDSASGVSAVLDLREWLYVNTDLTVHLLRPAQGEWLCLDARMTVGPGGAAMATSKVYDESGLVGRSAQVLVIAPR